MEKKADIPKTVNVTPAGMSATPVDLVFMGDSQKEAPAPVVELVDDQEVSVEMDNNEDDLNEGFEEFLSGLDDLVDLSDEELEEKVTLTHDEEDSSLVTVEVEGDESDGSESMEITFKLDAIPGAGDLVDDPEEENPVEEVSLEEPAPRDQWDWEGFGGTRKFLEWLSLMFDGVPKHSGRDTTGVERALAYFERLNTEISRAMRKDYKREIDAAKAEEARAQIDEGIGRLIDRLETLKEKKFKKTRKKKAFVEGDIVKNASAATSGRVVINVPYFVSIVARVCINASVQGGKDMKDVFTKVAEDYTLNKREKFQVVQLLQDMGYPTLMDRVLIGDGDMDPTSTDTRELATNYYA